MVQKTLLNMKLLNIVAANINSNYLWNYLACVQLLSLDLTLHFSIFHYCWSADKWGSLILFSWLLWAKLPVNTASQHCLCYQLSIDLLTMLLFSFIESSQSFIVQLWNYFPCYSHSPLLPSFPLNRHKCRNNLTTQWYSSKWKYERRMTLSFWSEKRKNQ